MRNSISVVLWPICRAIHCGTTYATLVPPSARTELAVDVTIDFNERDVPDEIELAGQLPAKLKRYLKRSLKSGRYRAATDDTGEPIPATLTFTQTFNEPDLSVTSRSEVDDWSRMMVAQTCQTQGIQRI